MPNRQSLGLVLGPLMFLLILLIPTPAGITEQGIAVAAVATLMAIWWISEAIPIPATALLPIVLFPLLEVMPTQQVSGAYANHLIYLFIGGFMIAVTMEKWQLHRRIALHTIHLIGVSPKRIIFGFMLATGFLSMWISNTATAMMMVTIGIAVLKQVDRVNTPFGTSLMLGIAYAASIGGVATLIGTPPNAILAGVAENSYGISIGFAQWMLFATPLSVAMMLLSWLYLTHVVYRGSSETLPGGKQAIENTLREMGPISRQERRVLIVFSGVALAWLFRSLIEIDALRMVSDASIAIGGAILLFIIPADFHKREFLLDWQTALRIPWDIIILFGGGFALAEGFSHSGLTHWIAQQLSIFDGVSIVVLLAAIVFVVVFLTEVTSNTATASILLPVMGAMALGLNIHPLLSMTGVAIAASFAFMLPVATPPNAIVFGSRSVTIPQMAKAGIYLNLIGVVLITLVVMILLPAIMGFEIHQNLNIKAAP